MNQLYQQRNLTMLADFYEFTMANGYLESGAGDYDVIVPSDYMIGQMIAEDMLAELDFSLIPNYEKIDSQYKNLSFDPDNKYSVPYAWGTVGIIYNTSMVDGEIDSWSALYDDKYAGKVLLINNSRDAIGEALFYLGYSVNTTDEAEAGMESFLAEYTESVQPLYDYESRATYVAEFEGFRGMFMTMGGALSFIIGLVGVLNFVNAVVTKVVCNGDMQKFIDEANAIADQSISG